MLVAEIKVGARFIDPWLRTSPPHYRMHEVVEVDGYTRFFAKHIHSGQKREFKLQPEDVESLVKIGQFPILQCNLDGLVGDRCRVTLVDGGTLHGTTCTAVLYDTINIDGAVFSVVKGIEFEHSATTTYPLRELRKIVRMGRAK